MIPETWRNTKPSNNKLQTFVNKCLRRILKISWTDRVTNEDLRKQASQEANKIQIRKRKWRWIGHTLKRQYPAMGDEVLVY